jgi:hypothetical protein
MQNLEKLLEGTYQYFQNGQNYSQENFTVDMLEETHDLIFNSEILSRVETGEFFKMQVRYRVNQFYAVQEVSVDRSLGSKISKELFELDHQTQILKYTFKSNSSSHTVERPFSSKHFIAAPCFLTSALFTLTKKIDTTARTPVVFITPKNEWDFLGAPEDKVLWVELKAHDVEDFNLAGASFTASKFEIHEEDSLLGAPKPGAQLWVSKLWGVPFQIEDPSGTKIVARKFKKLRQEMEKLF